MDMEPISDRVLILAEPDQMDAMSKPSGEFKYSVPKGKGIRLHHKLMGAESILSAEVCQFYNILARF